MADNVFDQFDAAKPKANPFDQFDTTPKTEIFTPDPTHLGATPDPTAGREFISSLPKVGESMLAGGSQLFHDIPGVPPLPPALQEEQQARVRSVLAPNQTWGGTAGELVGGAPLLAAGTGLAPAAIIGGLQATPSGSVGSHLANAGISAAIQAPFSGAGAITNFFGRKAAATAAERAAAQQAATQELRTHLAERSNAARVAADRNRRSQLSYLADRARSLQ